MQPEPTSSGAGKQGRAHVDDALARTGTADRKTGKRTTGYEYAVLVTNLAHEILSLGQLYRDRADAENAFDYSLVDK